MNSSIGIEKARLYEQYRLPYARQAVDDLLQRIGPIQVIADIGAGTGQVSRLFLDRGVEIYAVEPDDSMRHVGKNAIAIDDSIVFIDGLAERTTLADKSVNLIVIGNAFHRFKPEACEELHRILKKDGWIALFRYSFLNDALWGILFSKLAELKGLAGKMEKSWHRTPIESLFGNGRIDTFSCRQSQAEDWKAFFGAACSGIEAPNRNDPEFAQFEAINREVFDSFAVDGKIQIDYETQVSYGQPVF